MRKSPGSRTEAVQRLLKTSGCQRKPTAIDRRVWLFHLQFEDCMLMSKTTHDGLIWPTMLMIAPWTCCPSS